MTGDNGTPLTPEWSLPKPPPAAETLVIPSNITLGTE